MEPLFINSYKRDKRIFKEMFKYEMFGTAFNKFLVALWIIAVATLALVCIPSRLYFDLILVVGFSVFLYFVLYALYASKTKALTHADKEMTYGKGLDVETSFYEDYVEFSTSTEEKILVKYYLIKKVKVLKNITLIKTKAGLLYALKNNAFTKGELYDCLQLLKSKDIKVK